MTAAMASTLKALSAQWDPVHTRAQSDRSSICGNGDIHSCTASGCELGVKSACPTMAPPSAQRHGNSNAMSARFAYDHQIAYVAGNLPNLGKKPAGKLFWTLSMVFRRDRWENRGCIFERPAGDYNVRSFGCSMVDFNRIPKLLYYAYQAAWVPFSIKPVGPRSPTIGTGRARCG